MKNVAAILSSTLLVSTSAFSAVITAPVVVKYDGIFKTSGLVGLSTLMTNDMLKDLNKAVSDVCGRDFFVLDLDTRLTVSQPKDSGTASYGIVGTVTCENNL